MSNKSTFYVVQIFTEQNEKMIRQRQKIILIFGKNSKNQFIDISSRLLWFYTNCCIIDEDAQNEIDAIYFNCNLAHLETYLNMVHMDNKILHEEALKLNEALWKFNCIVGSSKNCTVKNESFHLHVLIENNIYGMYTNNTYHFRCQFRADEPHRLKESLRNILVNWLQLFLDFDLYKTVEVSLLQGFCRKIATYNEWKHFVPSPCNRVFPLTSPNHADQKRFKYYQKSLWILDLTRRSISDDLESLARLPIKSIVRDDFQWLYHFQRIKTSDLKEYRHHIFSCLCQRVRMPLYLVHKYCPYPGKDWRNDDTLKYLDRIPKNDLSALSEFDFDYIQYLCSRFTFTIK